MLTSLDAEALPPYNGDASVEDRATVGTDLSDSLTHGDASSRDV
jgi:hypothetical protein